MVQRNSKEILVRKKRPNGGGAEYTGSWPRRQNGNAGSICSLCEREPAMADLRLIADEKTLDCRPGCFGGFPLSRPAPILHTVAAPRRTQYWPNKLNHILKGSHALS